MPEGGSGEMEAGGGGGGRPIPDTDEAHAPGEQWGQ